MIKQVAFRKTVLLAALVATLYTSCSSQEYTKINGVSFVAPPKKIDKEALIPVKNIGANWIAITPYAFSRGNTPAVTYDHNSQWWGETKLGVIRQIQYAKELGLQVMLKPHVWVLGQGWAGDYQLANENEWLKWSKDYSKYIIEYAQIADSMNVPLLCIGTEYRQAVKQHPELWIELIKEVRKVYNGKLVYAANWDNYENVTFWDELDFIGIDAYFPLLEEHTSNSDQLINEWIPIKQEIQAFSVKWGKPILFSEYGYRSIDYATAGHWKLDPDTLNINLIAQEEAYKALYQTFWNENWFVGGFLWKWHSDHKQVKGWSDKEFTPQNKPVESIIKRQYSNQ